MGRKALTIGVIGTASLVVLGLALFGRGDRSHYQAHSASGISVDGQMTEPAWFRAPKTAVFVNMFDYGSPQKTTARIVYDEKYIYIAFECEDTFIWSTKTQRDDALWEEEVVDVFIDARGDGKYYREYQVNPLGTQVDLVIPEPGREKNWMSCATWSSANLKSAVAVLGTLNPSTESAGAWVVEMAIPFSDFADCGVRIPPERGDQWRLQLFRIDRPQNATRPVCCSWSPSRGAFHEPKNFGSVTWD